MNPMRTPSAPSPTPERYPRLQHLRSRIAHHKQQIRISELERAVITEIVAYANFHSLHNDLTEGQRQHVLKKYWAELQAVEQHLQRCQRSLHLVELQLAREELVQHYTPQLTQLANEIQLLRPQVPTPTSRARVIY
jgi:hypothetical protein